MRFKLLPLLLSIVLLSVSCSNEGRGFFLEGESESEVFLHRKDVLVRITIPTEEIDSYRDYASLEADEAFESLFGVETAAYAVTDSASYDKRNECYSIIMDETGSDNIPHMLSLYSGDLRKTSFDNTMNEFSEGYDTNGLLKAAGDSTVTYEYDLASVLPQSAPWEEKERFIRLWSRQILRSR